MPDLATMIVDYLEETAPPVAVDDILHPHLVSPGSDRRELVGASRNVVIAIAAAAVVLGVAGLAFVLGTQDQSGDDPVATDTTVYNAPRTSTEPIAIAGPALDPSGAARTNGTRLPDFERVVQGDDGALPAAVGVVTDLPDSVRLDFLFEFCTPQGCFRDAHFMDPDNPGMGSGPFTADEPFHVRHGFINNSGEPLGPGYNVVLYVTLQDVPGEFGGNPQALPRRFSPDYVIQETVDRCGPTYRAHPQPVSCESFVHEFPQGLPAGRYAIWAVWEAPCSAWLELGFAESCADPTAVEARFASGFDTQMDRWPPAFIEPDGGDYLGSS